MPRGRKAREAEELKTKRRAQIMEAAIGLFHREDITTVTMARIAAEAELSKAAVYIYFQSKEDLLFSLLNEQFFREAGALTVKPGETGGEALYRLCRRSLQDYTENLALKHIVMNFDRLYTTDYPAGLSSAEEWKQRIRQSLHSLTLIIRRGIEDGSLRPDLDPETTAAMLGNTITLFGGTTAVRRTILMQDQGLDPYEQYRLLLTTLLQGITARTTDINIKESRL